MLFPFFHCLELWNTGPEEITGEFIPGGVAASGPGT